MRYPASIRAAAVIAASRCVFPAVPSAGDAVRSLELGDHRPGSSQVEGVVETADRAAFATKLEGVAPTFGGPFGHDLGERTRTSHRVSGKSSPAAVTGCSSAS